MAKKPNLDMEEQETLEAFEKAFNAPEMKFDKEA